MQFEDALKLAQELGYAEKDPTADIEGHDACRKICIIASLVFGKHVYPDSVTTKGISQVSLEDVAAADVLGCAVKLIACVEKLENGKILPTVMPMLVPQENIIAGVSDVFNAVLVYGDGIDQTMFYGRGAGKLPTASAVLGDVIEFFHRHGNLRKIHHLSQISANLQHVGTSAYPNQTSLLTLRAFTARTVLLTLSQRTSFHTMRQPKRQKSSAQQHIFLFLTENNTIIKRTEIAVLLF